MSIEQEICDAVAQLNASIFTESEATNFLLKLAFDKNNISRLFAWLRLFNLIPEHRTAVPAAVAGLHESYLALVAKELKDPEAPLEKLKPKDANVIRADIGRSIRWFHKIAAGALADGLPPDATVTLHAYRILTLISLLGEDYTYTQGFDRYLFVTYLLGLVFTTAGKLPPAVAESLSYHLTAAILPLPDVNSVLNESDKSKAVNARIDERVAIAAPDLTRQLRGADLRSYHYALRWRLLFFTDEHKWPNIPLIWDAIFARREFVDDIFTELAVAHMAQIPAGPDVSALQRIQQYRDWDVERLLRDATEKYEVIHPRKTFRGEWLVALSVVLLLYLLIRMCWQ
jgi:hypothetical protein